jgi:hypothetical protein
MREESCFVEENKDCVYFGAIRVTLDGIQHGEIDLATAGAHFNLMGCRCFRASFSKEVSFRILRVCKTFFLQLHLKSGKAPQL